MEITPGPHKGMQSVNVTSRPQSQKVTESLKKITPGPVCQNMKSFEIIPKAIASSDGLHESDSSSTITSYGFYGDNSTNKVTCYRTGGLIPDTQSPNCKFSPKGNSIRCDLSSFTTIGTFGVVESVGLPPKPPHKVMESGGVIPISQANSGVKVDFP